MLDESEEYIFEFERNQLDNFAENPFLLEAPGIAFQETFFHNGVPSGMQSMFGLEKHAPDHFLEDIDAMIFSEDTNLIDLNKLFKENGQSQHSTLVEELTNRLTEVQKKAFSSVCMNKTIGRAFHQHFENYCNLLDSSEFIQKFSLAFNRLISQIRRVPAPGISLILMVYQFWMRMFRDFVREIWRHSERHTTDILKHKGKQSMKGSTVSSYETDTKDKRKSWEKQEVEELSRAIEEGVTQSTVKQLSWELQRTPSSILSKINKLKQQNNCKEIALERKIENVLRMNPQGLSKEEVIRLISQNFQMGEESSWKRSVGQILSSRKEIDKTKGVYTLLKGDEVLHCESPTSMKGRLIACLLKCPRYEADLKKITEVYGLLYGATEDPEKMRALEVNISKTLCRYDIFGKERVKTIYRWIESVWV